jgi:hypothetical protein
MYHNVTRQSYWETLIRTEATKTPTSAIPVFVDHHLSRRAMPFDIARQ